MTGINPNNMLDYKWSEFKPVAPKPEAGKVESLEQALEDGKLTQTEIKDLKAKFEAANPSKDFYSELSRSTGIIDDQNLRSSASEPVEFKFERVGNQIVASRINGSKSEYAGGNDGYDVKDGKVEVKSSVPANQPAKPAPSEASFREALGGLKTVEVSKEKKEKVANTREKYDWVPSIPFIQPFTPKPQFTPLKSGSDFSTFGWTYKKVGTETVTSEKVTPAQYKRVDSLVEGGKPSDVKALQKAINDGRPEGSAKISEDGALGPKTLAAAADNFQKNPSEANKQVIKDIIDGKYGNPNEKVKALLRDLIAEPAVSASSAKMTSEEIKEAVPEIISDVEKKPINAGNAETWKAEIKGKVDNIKASNPKAGEMVEEKVKEVATKRADKITNVSAENIHEAKALVTSGFVDANHPLQAKVKAYEASNGGEVDKDKGIKEFDLVVPREKAQEEVDKINQQLVAKGKEPLDNFEDALALAAMAATRENSKREGKEYTQFIPKVTQLADGSYHVEVFCK